MAGYDLIDAYLQTLGRHLRWRRDVDDLFAEVGDHLYSATHRLEAQGIDRESAQHDVLTRFGNASVVATGFASTSNGGTVAPTRFTKRSGFGARTAGLLWVGFAATWAVGNLVEDNRGQFDGLPRIIYIIGAVSLIAAAVLTTVVMVALHRRHGGLGILKASGIVIAIPVGSLLLAVGLVGLGRWLAAEDPVVFDSTQTLVAF